MNNQVFYIYLGTLTNQNSYSIREKEEVMKGRWNQKLCAVATVSMLLSSAPVGVLAQENARITQSDPEEVYVDIIGDGQRTTLFNENWKFHRGDINDAQNKDTMIQLGKR